MKKTRQIDAEAAQERLDRFDQILIGHPRDIEAQRMLDSLALQTRHRVANTELRRNQVHGRPIKPLELWIQPIIGPSGAGKSTCIDSYLMQAYAKAKDTDSIPVLVVTLHESVRSPRQLQAAILEAFGDPSAAKVLKDRGYSEAYINNAIRKIAREKGTYLIILDETHNIDLTGPVNQRAMAMSMKSLVNDGIFSLVVVGTSDVVALFNNYAELKSRQKEFIDFGALQATPTDMAYFMEFVQSLEGEMLERKVIDGPIGFHEAVNCALAYDMSSGIIGVVSRILRVALDRAHRNGRFTPNDDDLSAGFYGWKEIDEVKNGKTKVLRYDPFVSGIRDSSSKAAEAADALLEKQRQKAA